MDMNSQWISLQEVIRHTLKMIEGQTRLNNITIHTDIPPDMGNVLIDSDKIKQVLLNLYLNAVGAMENGGTLSVTLTPHNSRTIRIDVSDTGKGIDEMDLARIFDPYFTTKSSGTGLGLAIVYKIIEAHDGEIRVMSESGKGTTVSVFLPTGPTSVTPA
jgi:two-component system sensor histidine kinase HydH